MELNALYSSYLCLTKLLEDYHSVLLPSGGRMNVAKAMRPPGLFDSTPTQPCLSTITLYLQTDLKTDSAQLA